MSSFSTVDALITLTTSIPEWNQRLDDLNGQISRRQIELAQLQENERPIARSLKNKGSTESLRPKDGNEAFFFSDNAEITGATNPVDSTNTARDEPTSNPRPSSPAAARTAAASSSPLPKPTPLSRNSSQPTPPTALHRPVDFKIRKRKTESLASGESLAPKYRTRSMIIVYYDSAVQTAFEDLVKFVSGSRNSMRKGKMAAKMAEMRRVAELEADEDEEDDDDYGAELSQFKATALLSVQKNVVVGKEGESGVENDEEEMPLPKLRFVSTRQMGPSRDQVPNRAGNMPSFGMLRGYRRSGVEGVPDIFDDLDKGLEWCQSQCEHAAHQFLRDGECTAEIENIKRKLAEVKETAEKEIEKLKSEAPTTAIQQTPEHTKPRALSCIKVRKELSNMKDLEVDDVAEMEVDEGIEDDDGPPTLVFKKARDYRP